MNLYDRIAAIDEQFSGTIGVAARNLHTGEELRYNANHSFSPASTVKLPVLYEVLRQARAGRFNLSDPVQLKRENMIEGGVLADLTEGLTLSVRDMSMLMITVSDNAATNEMLDLVSAEAVNRSMDELGLSGLRINRKIGLGMERPLGNAVPEQFCKLLELIATDRVLTPEDCHTIIDMMKRQKFKEWTVRFLDDWDDEAEEPLVQAATKSGWVRGVRNDVGIIWAPRSTYVLAMFSNHCQDRRYWPDNEANGALARISQEIFREWGRA